VRAPRLALAGADLALCSETFRRAQKLRPSFARKSPR